MPELSAGPDQGAWHPSRADLLLAAEGDLPEDESLAIQRHLRECLHCQAFVADTDDFVERYRHTIDTSLREAPRQARQEFGERLTDAARASVQQRSRLPNRGWLRFAAVLPLALLLFLPGRFAPTLKANELLERASAAEERRPSSDGAQSVNVRVTGPGASAVRSMRIRPGAVLTRGESVVLERAGLEWRAPLSAAAFSRWRQQLRSKSDRVTETGSEITIETRSLEGEIRSGTLWLERPTLRPFRIEWELADQSRIRIDEAEGAGELAASSRSEKAADGAGTDGAASVANGAGAAAGAAEVEAELNHVEVEVRRALHRAGADVTEDVTLARSTRQITVSGVVSSAARKTELTDALRALPRVTSRLMAPEEVAMRVPTAAPTVFAQREARPALLTDWLTQHFPDADARQRFGAEALAHARDGKAHALAWQRLATRYSDRELARLDRDDRQAVRALFASHREKLAASLASLDRQLSIVWKESGASSDDAAAATTMDEQASVSMFVTHVLRIDRLLWDLFADVDTDEPSGPQVLSGRLRELRGDLMDCRRWLDQASRREATPGT